MIKNYFKIAWRNLLQNKTSSAINIGGLAIGMAVSFMLLIYVYNEYSFDCFHTNTGRLYQVFKNQPTNGEIRTKWFTQQILAQTLKKEFPEVQNTARINEAKDMLISTNDRGIKYNTVAADQSLFQLFDFDFVYGSKTTALTDPSALVITQSVATALFGNTNPVGQMVKLDDKFPMKVSAVIKDHRQNSGFTFKVIMPWEAFLAQMPWLKGEGWDNYAYATYVLLKPGASVDIFNSKIRDIVARHYPKDKEVKMFAFPFERLHLYGEFKNGVSVGGNIAYVRLFMTLALGILLTACINFMNLSTARSERRAREVGIRKTMGARRASLIKQFMGESLLMSALAFLFALALIVLLMPAFSNVIRTPLYLPYNNFRAWMVALVVVLAAGVVAGSYPALFLSSFKPVAVLKGRLTAVRTTLRPRQILVVVQFTFATGLIISSIFIYKQLNYIKNLPAGYNRNGLIELPADGAMYDKFESFRQEAITAGAISDGAAVAEQITQMTNATWANTWPGQAPGEDKIPIDCIGVTYHMLNTYGLQLIKGRDFSTARPSDSTAVILNEAAVKLMRFKDPVGQHIKWMNVDRTVIGVVKDFVVTSPYEPAKPLIIGFVAGWVGNIALRLNPANPVSKNLLLLQDIYKKYNPQYPFEFKFTDDNFSKKYQNEQQLGTMAVTFTVLAIMISCLGLFGLSAFSAEQRQKEIGIRKILGAGVANLWLKLSGEFVKLVLASFVIGSAIGWYAVKNWLTRYAYHTTIDMWVFVVTLIVSLGICLMAVSWQAIKAAIANPVKSLRSE